VVAGVDYELDSIYSNPAALDEFLVRRSRDNLSVAVDLTRMPRQMTHPSGDGAAHLLDDLVDDFIPCVEQHFDVAPGPNALMGHSGGGYFSLYAALARPAVFNRIAAGHQCCLATSSSGPSLQAGLGLATLPEPGCLSAQVNSSHPSSSMTSIASWTTFAPPRPAGRT
jgi:pimeloyl-ACP methyl ester carboxylesterase